MRDECVIGGRWDSHNGYRLDYVDGRQVRAHRLAYCRAHGLELEDIEGLVVRHKCDNPPCCNPDHLELGTHQDNMDDMWARGRGNPVSGEAHHGYVLSDEQVQEIRERYVPRCPINGQRAMAREYGVSQGHISGIIHGKERTS